MKRLLPALAVLLFACPGPRREPSPAASPAGNRWSVLLITIDTLRADHMGAYGYPRATSPHMDALAKRGVVFEQAYTFWPKTRGSFVILMTGRRPSQNGYSKSHPVLLGFNPTLASVLAGAGYATAAVVDNPNVAAQHGYAKGFERYRETWEETALVTEMDRARAISDDANAFLRAARADRPFFLWLHYVNPHAPYTPPAPYDTAFLPDTAHSGPRLPVVPGFHGGIPRRWTVAGRDRLGYYVAQYDGEIAAVDAEVGRVLEALEASAARARTMVVLTSDHGESLGEHGYYFDHGEDLFDPSLRIPLMVALPGGPAGVRSDALASTVDLVPTILDAVKVSYPPDLAGESLLPALSGQRTARDHLYAGNDRNLRATWNRRLKLVAGPEGEDTRYTLYDRVADPGETRDVARSRPADLQRETRELALFQERVDREWAGTRRLTEGAPGETAMSREACEKLRSLGYVGRCGS